MSSYLKKSKTNKSKVLNNEEKQIVEQLELNEEEKKVLKQRRFGFNAFDSAVGTILGGVIAPVVMTLVGVFILSLISALFGVGTDVILNIPFLYAIFSCCTIFGYGIYVFILCKRKSKQSIKKKEVLPQIKKKELVPNSKCSIKGVIIAVCVGALALLLLNLFVNMTTYGLQGLGYSKSNALPFEVNNIWTYLLCLVFLSALPAFCEEFLFRGLILGGMLNTTKSHIQSICAVLISALVFALCHQSAQQFVFPLIMGVVFGFIYLYSGNIWYSVIAHFSSNALVFTMNLILNLTNTTQGALNINWIYCFLAMLGLIVFGVVMFFLFRYVRIKMKNKSVFDIENSNVRINLIEENLIENPNELKVVSQDGIVSFNKTRAEKNRQSIFIGIVALIFLFALLINDLVVYC